VARQRRQPHRGLPDISLYKTVFEARYKPALGFYMRLIPAAERLDEYPHWETDRLSVILKDPDKRCSLAIQHLRIVYHQDLSDITQEEERIQHALSELPEALEIPSYERLGLRRRYLIAVDVGFEELVRILNIKLLSQDERLKKVMPSVVDDLMYRVDFSEDPFRFHFTVGPVRGREMPQYIGFNKEHHLSQEGAEQDYSSIIKTYPSVAVFVDVDSYRQGEIPTDEALEFTHKARNRVENTLTQLRDYLFAREVGD